MEFPPDQYVWKTVADEIERRIAEGLYKPRMPLPGELRLAEEFGVAVRTLRRAIAELKSKGLLMTLPAKGTFVVDRDVAGQDDTDQQTPDEDSE